MSDDQAPKRPSHHAFNMRDGNDGKTYSDRIGAAWEHKDRQGYTVQLDSVPVNGRVTLRTTQDRLNDMREEKQPEAKKVAGHER